MDSQSRPIAWDARRDDAAFHELLGKFEHSNPDKDGGQVLNQPPAARSFSNDPTFLSNSAVYWCLKSTHEKYFQEHLHHFCIRNGFPPCHSTILSDAPFRVALTHDVLVFNADSTGETELAAKENASRLALSSLIDDYSIELCTQCSISLRSACRSLPFAIKFQIERLIFEKEELLIDEGTSSGVLGNKKANIYKLLLVLIQLVVPPLLRVSWFEKSMTWTELFAEQLWNELLDVRYAILNGTDISFSRSVASLDKSTSAALKKIEDKIGYREHELFEESTIGLFDKIVARSKWPAASFKAKIVAIAEPESTSILHSLHLEPSELEVSCSKSRRALREWGWTVRDRFLSLNVQFIDLSNVAVAKWLGEGQPFCGRCYEYLFDKSTGVPKVWLFSSTGDYARAALLDWIGNFEGIEPPKLGDRIGLAFSETFPALQLSLGQIIMVDDIIEDGFDGAGVVSTLLLDLPS